MSSPDSAEIQAAAAEGAAAAVNAVQDEQRQESIVENAETAAEIAAMNAQDATAQASEASETAGAAVAAAVESQQTAEAAASAAAEAQAETWSVREELTAMRQEAQQRDAELREFLAQRATPPEPEVTEVTVAPQQAPDQSDSTPAPPPKRHRFGR